MDAAVTYTDAKSDNVGGSSTTFSSVTIGTASSDRYVVVVATVRTSGISDITMTCTIAGVSATSVATVASLTASAHRQNIFIAAVPTGTTGNVVLTFSRSSIRSMISVFAVTGIDGLTASATATSTASPGSGTITIPAGGIAIAGSYNILGGAYTWSNLTEQHYSVFNTNNYWAAASDAFATLQTSRVITATMAGSPVQPVHCFAAWSPSIGGGPAGRLLRINSMEGGFFG